MTNSYDQNKDIFGTFNMRERGFLPARDAKAVTPSDSVELPFYGRLIVTNSQATTTEDIVVIMAANNVDM